MSIILDALRKAEMERSRQGSGLAMLGPDLASAKRHAYPVAGLVLAGLIAGIAMALVGVALLVPTPKRDGVAPRILSPRVVAPPESPGSKMTRTQARHETVSPLKPVLTHTARTQPVVQPSPIHHHFPPSAAWQIQVFSWASQRSNRYVVINMHLYHAGDRLPGGARLLAIHDNGLLVEDRGRRYFVPRP